MSESPMHPYICEMREIENDWEWRVMNGEKKMASGKSGTQDAAGIAAVSAIDRIVTAAAPRWGDEEDG